MGFSGISLGSLLMIGFVGLLAFGPEQLKKISRELGESLGELKKGLDRGQSTSSESLNSHSALSQQENSTYNQQVKKEQ